MSSRTLLSMQPPPHYQREKSAMKYLLSGILGFSLTLLVSLPFQNVVKMKEAKAFAAQIGENLDRRSGLDVSIKPIVQTVERKDEPRIKFYPQYPVKAAAKKMEGFVTLSFIVAKDGSVYNVKVTESSPPKVFDQAAVEAVLKWKYSYLDMKKPQQKLRLNFSLGHTIVEQRAD